MSKYLIIGSTESYAGKSSTIVGLCHQLTSRNINISYGKPLGSCFSIDANLMVEEDVNFIAQTLSLPPSHVRPTLLTLDQEIIQKRLSGEDQNDYHQDLRQYLQINDEDLVLIEGAGNLQEGRLFNLSLLEIADILNAPILLVARYHSVLAADVLLSVKKELGDRLLGVLINDIPSQQIEMAATLLKPFLESHNIPVLGMLPKSSILSSISVRELVLQLKADVLCRGDRLDLMVETLKIGAMNVNAAIAYFRQSHNMAIVTGGDRVDIQLAALEASTQCLILTGRIPPQPMIINRADDLEIPILSVDLDTLTTVEIIERTFKEVRLHEPIKVEFIRQLMSQHFDTNRLINLLNL
jgi:uncharacterized protein